MNSTNYAFKISQTSVAEPTLFGSALAGFASLKGSEVVMWFQIQVASFVLRSGLRFSQQLTSNQSSLRSKLLRGTRNTARPLARR